ncbi:MAG: RNA polymerase sigma factor [Verrucomicrobia bacterium]|nr:RNA polymerase sigma factor [Verrucomicrobiota bacterium]
MPVAQSDEASADAPRAESIEALFHALESPLLGYAFRLLQDAAAAEDIVQDAFLKLHAQFDAVREPRRWLYRTVHNQALNHRRHAAKVVPLHPEGESGECASPGPDPADAQPLPDEQIARWEEIGQVRLSLEALDERSRELIRLKFNDELSYQEISQRTGLKTGYVGYLLHHALKTIAAELAATGVVP